MNTFHWEVPLPIRIILTGWAIGASAVGGVKKIFKKKSKKTCEETNKSDKGEIKRLGEDSTKVSIDWYKGE